MVGNICEIKNRIVEYIDLETRDVARMDTKEIGELVDMVKDLAEAEKNCHKATYYETVVDAMGAKRTVAHTKHHDATSMEAAIGSLAEEYRKLPEADKITMKSKVLTMLGSM